MRNIRKAKKLYNNLLKLGLDEVELGSFDEFLEAVSSAYTANRLYNSLVDIGFSEYELGSRDEFHKTFVYYKPFWEKVKEYFDRIKKRLKSKKLY